MPAGRWLLTAALNDVRNRLAIPRTLTSVGRAASRRSAFRATGDLRVGGRDRSGRLQHAVRVFAHGRRRGRRCAAVVAAAKYQVSAVPRRWHRINQKPVGRIRAARRTGRRATSVAASTAVPNRVMIRHRRRRRRTTGRVVADALFEPPDSVTASAVVRLAGGAPGDRAELSAAARRRFTPRRAGLGHPRRAAAGEVEGAVSEPLHRSQAVNWPWAPA